MKSADIRSKFLEYFRVPPRNHREVPSASLVPADDPTLLFTNAGMVQFKRVFQGVEHRDYARATTCEKCVRASGKRQALGHIGSVRRSNTVIDLLGHNF